MYAIHHHYQEKARAALAQANAHHQLAIEAVADAKTSDAKALAAESQLKTQATTVETLRQEVNGLRVKLQLKSLSDPPQQSPSLPVDLPVPDLMPLVAKQTELIQAQDGEILSLKTQAATLSLARDQWREAAQRFQQEAFQTHAALQAHQSATTWAKLKWGAVGFGLGALTTQLAVRF